MKKILSLVFALVLVFALAACGSRDSSADQTPPPDTNGPTDGDVVLPPTTDGSAAEDLSNWMNKLLEGTESDMSVMTETIPPDAYPANLFIDYIDGAQAVSSSAMMSAVAHSICLLQVPEGSDAKKIAEQINQNKDPRKWICVEAEKAVVLQSGNYILLAMSTEDIVDTVSANFKNLF